MPRPLICWQWEPAASMHGCGKRGPGSGTSGRCLCLSKGVREQLLEDSWYCSMQVCWQRGDRQSDLVLPRLPKEPAAVCKDAAEEHLSCTSGGSRAVLWARGQRRGDGFFPSLILLSQAEKRGFFSSTHYPQHWDRSSCYSGLQGDDTHFLVAL